MSGIAVMANDALSELTWFGSPTVLPGGVNVRPSALRNAIVPSLGLPVRVQPQNRRCGDGSCGTHADTIPKNLGPPPKSEHVLGRYHDFRATVEREFRCWHKVGPYARHLGYSPKSLDRSCRAAAANTAKRVIVERILLEVKRLLAHSQLPIASISHQLGFDEATKLRQVPQARDGNDAQPAPRSPQIRQADMTASPRTAGYRLPKFVESTPPTCDHPVPRRRPPTGDPRHGPSTDVSSPGTPAPAGRPLT